MFDKFRNARRNVMEISMPRCDLSEEEIQKIYTFFNTCVVNKDYSEVQEKLKETVTYRRQFFARSENQFDKIFDFYFVAPELVN